MNSLYFKILRFKQDLTGNSNITANSTVSANLNNLALSSTPASWSNANQPFNYADFNRRILPGFEIDRNYMFGYVFFRQVKDKSLKRGYFQKVNALRDYFFTGRKQIKYFYFSQSRLFCCRVFRSFRYSTTSCRSLLLNSSRLVPKSLKLVGKLYFLLITFVFLLFYT